jgi:hypothetical protein
MYRTSLVLARQVWSGMHQTSLVKTRQVSPSSVEAKSGDSMQTMISRLGIRLSIP